MYISLTLLAGLIVVSGIIGFAVGTATEVRRNRRFQISERYRAAEERFRAYGV